MDCRSCGIVNASGRRYCRECGLRLGAPCPICHFFNGMDDKHCGGCGRRLKESPSLSSKEIVETPMASYEPALADDIGFTEESSETVMETPAGEALPAQGVSQSEIDGLFENILEEEPGEGEA